MTASVAIAADTVDVSSATSKSSSEIYSQSMYRPDSRSDRSHGLFHETRLRASYGESRFKFDVGSYFLVEWIEASGTDRAFTNSALSPFVGAHWMNSWSGSSTTASLTLLLEGRHREPISDFSRTSGAKGWDPRTGAAFGVWHQFETLNLYLDLYADIFYAPKYSSSPMSTAIARWGNRHQFAKVMEASWGPFADLYLELFQQNATSIEMGTKRTEGRAGFSLGALHQSGSMQIRIYNGWPISSDRDPRSRAEVLLVGGFSL